MRKETENKNIGWIEAFADDGKSALIEVRGVMTRSQHFDLSWSDWVVLSKAYFFGSIEVKLQADGTFISSDGLRFTPKASGGATGG